MASQQKISMYVWHLVYYNVFHNRNRSLGHEKYDTFSARMLLDAGDSGMTKFNPIEL